MTLTKQQKALVLVLGLSLGGLGVDRLFLDSSATGPSVAEASAVSISMASLPSSDSAAAPSSDELGAEAATADRTALADRLDAIGRQQHLELSDVADAFRPSDSWLDSEALESDSKQQKIPAYKYRDSHRLVAVFAAGSGEEYVVISHKDNKGNPIDTRLRLGEELDGVRLIAINQKKRSARFVSGRDRVELSLDDDKSSR